MSTGSENGLFAVARALDRLADAAFRQVEATTETNALLARQLAPNHRRTVVGDLLSEDAIRG